MSGAAYGITANAAGGTYYPDDSDFTKKLTFSPLSDYAVDGGKYAFLVHSESGDGIQVFENGQLNDENGDDKVFENGQLKEYDPECDVDALDYSEGTLYYSSEGKVYSLPDYKESEHTITASESEITCGNYLYYFDADGALTVFDKQEKTAETFDGKFSNMKKFGETVYAVRENCLYEFTGKTYKLLKFTYSNYDATHAIPIGQTKEALQNYTLKFVTIHSGAHITEIDLSKLDGDNFVASETTTAKEDTLALLLCYTGNAAIVAVGDKSYITNKNSAEETQTDCYIEPEFTKATVIGNRIYCSPFVISGTTALFPATGEVVTILHRVEHPSLGSAFYEVEYNVTDENGEVVGTKTGYVTDGFLRKEIIEDNKVPTEVPDPSYSEKNDVRKVILILMVVILVLAAAGYLTYAATSGKRKKDKPDEVKKEN